MKCPGETTNIEVLILLTLILSIFLAFYFVEECEKSYSIYQLGATQGYHVDSYTIKDGCVHFGGTSLCGSYKIYKNYKVQNINNP